MSTPAQRREKILRDFAMAMSNLDAGLFGIAANAKEALAAADAIPDAPVECCAATRASTLLDAAQKVDGMVIGGRAWNERQQMAAEILFYVSKGLREMANEPVPKPPVPSRAELIEVMCDAWYRVTMDDITMGDVLDALVKAGAVR